MKNVCFKCFDPNHISRKCTKNIKCDICSKNHATLLHRDSSSNVTANVNNSVQGSSIQPQVVTHMTQGASSHQTGTGTGDSIYLQVVPIKIIGKGGKSAITYALLDSGSSSTLCSKKLLDTLGIDGEVEDLSLSTVNQHDVTIKAAKCLFTVESVTSDFQILLPEVWGINKLSISSRAIPLQDDVKKWNHLSHLEFPSVPDKEISILIGTNVPEALIITEYKIGPPNSPVGVKTRFGWTLMGKGSQRAVVNFVDLQEQVEKWWNIESTGLLPESKKTMSVEDQRALQKMEDTIKIVNGHYMVGLPWKHDEPRLPNNKSLALSRLQSVKRKLLRDEKYAEMYKAQVSEYIDRGYAIEAPPISDSSLVNYLSHHGVSHPQKPNKVRVVFDPAALFQGTSLNAQLLQGPTMTNDLLGVLLRFREGAIALKADVEGMFHQIKVLPKDYNALRFLWFPDGDLGAEPKEYMMTVHIFGAKSSPSCANFALRKTTEDNPDFSMEIKNAVLHDFYVDDFLKSTDAQEQAVNLITDLPQLLKRGGFRLHKWITSDHNIASLIPAEDKAPAMVDLDLDNDLIERTLGIYWDVKSDIFTFKVSPKNKPLTKRGVLSMTSSLYDPIGFVSPFVLAAKRIVQECFRRNMSWDEPLTSDLIEIWEKWISDLPLLSTLKIPRWYKNPHHMHVDECQLHLFGDACEYGYGVVAFLRMKTKNQDGDVIHCSFVMSKSRLSPIKTQTIPRLELQASVTAVRLSQTLTEELNYTIHKVVFWSDSTTVLKFIRNEKTRFSVFVANRIGEIRRSTNVDQWNYVPSEMNPGDEASRGQDGSTFLANKRWFEGPDFLYKNESEWPEEPTECQSTNESNEIKSFFAEVHQGPIGIDRLLQHVSSWYKIKRIFAWLQRFIIFLQSKVRHIDNENFQRSLSVQELNKAELSIISYVQKSTYPKEYQALMVKGPFPRKSTLYKLRPVLIDGVIRVSGRLQISGKICNNQIILPGDHIVTQRIVEEIDRKLKHTSGREYILAKVKERYWIMNGRRLIRRILNNCFACRKVRARSLTQQMSNLPPSRLRSYEPPFSSTGLDFFGHFNVKVKRSQAKRWGCVFTCMSSRAIHIELVESLDASSFINALRRFLSRRPRPTVIHSDNGTNFVGANNLLKAALAEWNESAKAYLRQEGIEWRFNPALASHMGGVWERQIASIRRILTSLVSNKTLDDFEMATVFAECEQIINDRPLTSNSDDPNDLEALTPNHLLKLRGQLNLPPGLFDKDDVYHRQKWRQVQYLADEFWQRWTKEYLPTLQERKKWNEATRNIKVNDIVLLVEKSLPRGVWPIARVIETYQGSDGLVRSAKVKTANSTFIRPIVKMCLLEQDQ